MTIPSYEPKLTGDNPDEPLQVHFNPLPLLAAEKIKKIGKLIKKKKKK